MSFGMECVDDFEREYVDEDGYFNFGLVPFSLSYKYVRLKERERIQQEFSRRCYGDDDISTEIFDDISDIITPKVEKENIK